MTIFIDNAMSKFYQVKQNNGRTYTIGKDFLDIFNYLSRNKKLYSVSEITFSENFDPKEKRTLLYFIKLQESLTTNRGFVKRHISESISSRNRNKEEIQRKEKNKSLLKMED